MGEKTKEQLLAKLLEIQKMLEEKVAFQDHMIKKFQMLTSNEGLFHQIIDYCPYPIAVFTQQGTLVAANNALIKETKIKYKDLAEGKCNIYERNSDNFQLVNAARQVFTGKTFFLENLKNPLAIFSETKRGSESPSKNFERAIVFSISDDDGKITHGVVVFTI